MFKLVRETTPADLSLANRHQWPVRITATKVARVTGSIAGTTLTVTDVAYGELTVGAVVTLVGVPDAVTSIVSFGAGTTGGVGTYTVDSIHTINACPLYVGGSVPAKIFVMQASAAGESELDNFSCVASAQQMEDLPEDAAGPDGPYYRVAQVTLLARNAEAAEEFDLKVQYATQDLADNIQSAATLAVESTTIITPSYGF